MRTFWLVLLVGCGTPQISMDAGADGAAADVVTESTSDTSPADVECPDRDNDRHLDRACGGDDCNDNDPAIAPGLPARCSSMDFNCNGTPDHQENASQDALDRWCRENVRSTDYLTWSSPPRCVRPNGNLSFPYASAAADVRCMACDRNTMTNMYGCACWTDRTGERMCMPGM